MRRKRSRKRPRNKTNTASTRLLRFHGSFFSARFCSCIWRFVRPSWSSTCLQMRNGLIWVDAYKKSRAFYIYERKLRYCIEVFFRVRKRASGNASMEKVLCVSVLVKFPRAETRAFLPQWKAALKRKMRKNYSSKKNKKFQHPEFNTPPPPKFCFTPFFFFNVRNSMKREENMKFWRIFFSILKNSNNIPSILKTIQHTPITWCTYLQSFEKIQQCVFELQCEN